MKTELKIHQEAITGGRQIDVVEYNVRNYRLRDTLEACARLLCYLVECDSNNTNSKIIPSEAREVIEQWNITKEELDFSLQYNDFPQGQHEYAYKISLLKGTEIQRVRNVKVKTVLTEAFHAMRVLVGVDSANTQGFIDLSDADRIKKAFEIVDAKIARWLGDGTVANTGRYAPAYEILGEMVPDVDSDYAAVLEPSSATPAPAQPDAPDSAGGDGQTVRAGARRV